MSFVPLHPSDHAGYMRLAISLAQESPLKPSNFRVGALVLDPATNTVLSTGYTGELAGNTHAEQCCLEKYASERGVGWENIGEVLPNDECVLYTTMEPCVKRMSGNESCVDRILRLRDEEKKRGIVKVYVGVREPDTFVKGNDGLKRLEENGVEWELVKGFEEEIMRVATAGHGDQKDVES